jgi:membrane protein implicated in regulation of membrane protease activity
MTETISILIPILIAIVFIIYKFFEDRAIEKAMKQPPQVGIESFVGKTAKVIAVIKEHENEKHLRVKLDGTSWNAIAKGESRKSIKVDDTVKVADIDNQKLIVT